MSIRSDFTDKQLIEWCVEFDAVRKEVIELLNGKTIYLVPKEGEYHARKTRKTRNTDT